MAKQPLAEQAQAEERYTQHRDGIDAGHYQRATGETRQRQGAEQRQIEAVSQFAEPQQCRRAGECRHRIENAKPAMREVQFGTDFTRKHRDEIGLPNA